MAGRTGKLTRALQARGPRIVLAEGEHDNGKRFMVIFREGQLCFSSGLGERFILMFCGDFVIKHGENYISFRTLAKSYTLGYLLKIGRMNQKVR